MVRALVRAGAELDEGGAYAGAGFVSDSQGAGLFDLSGRVAIVTGTSRGLGQYMARALAKAGADLVLTSRTRESLRAFESEIKALGRQAISLELDVRNLESIERMATEAHAAFGHLDILVNNAGCNVRKPALDVTWDDWNLILDTNLRGSFFVAQAVARHMIPRGYGRIINIGSVTSVAGYAGLGPYGASRGGIRQLTMSLADDWGKHGVTVNCLAPGWFRTEQNKVLYENKEWVEYLCDRIPVKRPGHPEDLDAAVVFLAAESSRYVTGQTLLVDGGISTGATRALVQSARASSRSNQAAKANSRSKSRRGR
jgi:gluconate 5-dehydrogenase